MSKDTYNLGGLRTWSEKELIDREFIVNSLTQCLKETLIGLNQAWKFYRVESPILTPNKLISSSYGEGDYFKTNHSASNDTLCLRAETTAGSYNEMARCQYKLPSCVYQLGKSFRRETNDGASASKYRYNEFYQLEFQCFFSSNSNADYHQALIHSLSLRVQHILNREIKIIESDRLPSYSDLTVDIEVWNGKKFVEIASCSKRNDFEKSDVVEIAFGIDRIVEIYQNGR